MNKGKRPPNTTDYLLLIDGDHYMTVMGEYRVIIVKCLENEDYTVEHCCTECRFVMPRGEEEANWCQDCCDADTEGS